MPLFLLGGALKIIGGVGVTIGTAILVTKVIIDVKAMLP